MRILWLMIVLSLYDGYAASVETSTLQCLNLSEIEDLKQDLKDLNKRFDKLSNRQDCNDNFHQGGWNSILLHQSDANHFGGDFNRSWHDFQFGFKTSRSYFIGLEKLYELTNYDFDQELLIVLKDSYGQYHAKYDLFRIANAYGKYTLTLGRYVSGDAGDAFGSHKGFKFSTFDKPDNDSCNFASNYGGGWWFPEGCKDITSILTGSGSSGIIWQTLKHRQFVSAEMRVRSKNKLGEIISF